MLLYVRVHGQRLFLFMRSAYGFFTCKFIMNIIAMGVFLIETGIFNKIFLKNRLICYLVIVE